MWRDSTTLARRSGGAAASQSDLFGSLSPAGLTPAGSGAQGRPAAHRPRRGRCARWHSYLYGGACHVCRSALPCRRSYESAVLCRNAYHTAPPHGHIYQAAPPHRHFQQAALPRPAPAPLASPADPRPPRDGPSLAAGPRPAVALPLHCRHIAGPRPGDQSCNLAVTDCTTMQRLVSR